MDPTPNNNMNNHRLLASAALFRGLYTEQLDQYDVLAKFINAAITINALHVFDITQCTYLLKNDFGFEIPEAVVRNCIKSKLRQNLQRVPKTQQWQRIDGFINDPALKQQFATAQKAQSDLTKKLVDHVAHECTHPLSGDEKVELIDDFNAHLKGVPRQNKNFPYIAHFIISIEENHEIKQIIENTRQGLIIFDGLRYSVESTGKTLTRDLAIYLDTEVLFSAGGLHGELRQQLFKDFHSLETEINRNAKRTSGKIQLRYFDETSREIDNYFAAAVTIADSQKSQTPFKQAMTSIVNGCTNGADVLSKKVDFFRKLDNLGIKREENTNYYDPPSYNIESESSVLELSKELSCETDKSAHALRQFSRINFLRRGHNKTPLESVGFIFLSEKSVTRSAAFSETVIKASSDGIPLATDLDYMTEWFWFKLNKGFCKTANIPVAFDVIARTRLVLSAQLGSKITHEYEQLLEKYAEDDTEIAKEDLGHFIAELKSKIRQPEQFTNNNIDLDFLADNDFFVNALAEHSSLKAAAEEGLQTKQKLDTLEKKSIQKQNELELKISKLEESRETLIRIQKLKELRNKRRDHNKPYILRSAYAINIAKFLYWFIPISSAIALILIVKRDADTPLAVFSTIFTVIPVIVTFALLFFNKRFQRLICNQKRQYLSSRLNLGKPAKPKVKYCFGDQAPDGQNRPQENPGSQIPS